MRCASMRCTRYSITRRLPLSKNLPAKFIDAAERLDREFFSSLKAPTNNSRLIRPREAGGYGWTLCGMTIFIIA
jgi:hypothetical protein